MRNYIVNIYHGVVKESHEDDSLLYALHYAIMNTYKGDVWQIACYKNDTMRWMTHTVQGIWRR